ncbi:hypothetical protein HDU76_011227, partial [Blyttiomyces sp. JEL0837]
MTLIVSEPYQPVSFAKFPTRPRTSTARKSLLITEELKFRLDQHLSQSSSHSKGLVPAPGGGGNACGGANARSTDLVESTSQLLIASQISPVTRPSRPPSSVRPGLMSAENNCESDNDEPSLFSSMIRSGNDPNPEADSFVGFFNDIGGWQEEMNDEEVAKVLGLGKNFGASYKYVTCEMMDGTAESPLLATKGLPQPGDFAVLTGETVPDGTGQSRARSSKIRSSRRSPKRQDDDRRVSFDDDDMGEDGLVDETSESNPENTGPPTRSGRLDYSGRATEKQQGSPTGPSPLSPNDPQHTNTENGTQELQEVLKLKSLYFGDLLDGKSIYGQRSEFEERNFAEHV